MPEIIAKIIEIKEFLPVPFQPIINVYEQV
jgi:hypothetical protein